MARGVWEWPQRAYLATYMYTSHVLNSLVRGSANVRRYTIVLRVELGFEKDKSIVGVSPDY